MANDLVVNLSGDNSKLKSSLKDSKSALSSFGTSARKAVNAGGKVLGGIGIAAVGAGVAGVAILGDRIGGLAGIADKAAQTGLSGAFLQRLGYAADQSGVSVETLQKGLSKMTILSGEAANGSKQAAAKLAEFGISANDLKTLSPEQQFAKIGAAIAKLPTESQRAAAAVELFGKSGLEMTGLFAGGVSQLNGLLEEAEGLGIGLSDEDLAKAAAADDAIQKMKASFGAIVDRVAVEFAPVFQQAAESVASMIPYIDGIAEAFASALDMAGSFWTKTQDYLTDVLTVAAVVVADMSTLWEGLFEDIPKFGKAAFDWLAANAGTMIENLGKMMRNLLNSVNHTGMQLGEEIAFQLGLSDEVLNIEATQSEQMTALTDFVMPQLSAETTQVMTDVSDALQVNEESRAKRDAANKMEANKTNVLAPSSVLDPTVGSVPEAKQLQSAGVMQRGSAEAFSTIVKSMMGGKDPVVAATEKQTKELVKELKANKPPKLVFAAEF
jgi:hypothetical protein